MSLARIFYDLVRTGLHGRRVAPTIRYYWPLVVPTLNEQKSMTILIFSRTHKRSIPAVHVARVGGEMVLATFRVPGTVSSFSCMHFDARTGLSLCGTLALRIDRGHGHAMRP